jgi:hypothetical protein
MRSNTYRVSLEMALPIVASLSGYVPRRTVEMCFDSANVAC